MKKIAYDTYYLEKEYFGKPYKGLIDFFKSYDNTKKLLDLGGGQGRDSLPIATLGYKVLCVDHSSVGINELLLQSKRLGLDIEGIVADLYAYQIDDSIDIVLMDSILHFYSKDINRETALLRKVLDEIKEGGLLVNCMIKGDKREKLIKSIISEHSNEWTYIEEKYVEYPEVNSTYQMIVIKKGINY